MDQGFKVQKLTAFVAVDDNGTEGVIKAQLGNTTLPLICEEEIRIRTLYTIAEAIKAATGQEYKILQFSNCIDVTKQTKDLLNNLFI